MLAGPVYLRKGLQALLQNMLNMPLRNQPLTFAVLQCICLAGAAEHATLSGNRIETLIGVHAQVSVLN